MTVVALNDVDFVLVLHSSLNNIIIEEKVKQILQLNKSKNGKIEEIVTRTNGSIDVVYKWKRKVF